jgi:hypothetical protein
MISSLREASGTELMSSVAGRRSREYVEGGWLLGTTVRRRLKKEGERGGQNIRIALIPSLPTCFAHDKYFVVVLACPTDGKSRAKLVIVLLVMETFSHVVLLRLDIAKDLPHGPPEWSTRRHQHPGPCLPERLQLLLHKQTLARRQRPQTIQLVDNEVHVRESGKLEGDAGQQRLDRLGWRHSGGRGRNRVELEGSVELPLYFREETDGKGRGVSLLLLDGGLRLG